MRRTVNISFEPEPLRAITTPEKIWIRSLSPSRMRVCTSTVSPISNCGTSVFRLDCSTSLRICWLMAFISFRVMRPRECDPWACSYLSYSSCQQVGPSLASSFDTVLSPPGSDLGVIAAQQNFRHLMAAILAGPRVLAVLQQSVAGRKRIVPATVFVAQDSRHEADDRVDHRHRGDFASVQDKVADRDFLRLQNIAHALVEALVPTAQQQQPLVRGQFFDHSSGSAAGLAG